MSLDMEQKQTRDELDEVVEKILTKLSIKGEVKVQHESDTLIGYTAVYIDDDYYRLNEAYDHLTFERRILKALAEKYGPLREERVRPFQRFLPVAEKVYSNDKVSFHAIAVALGPGFKQYVIKLKQY